MSFQWGFKGVPREFKCDTPDEVAAYEKSTEQFRIFTEAVNAYIDEMSALGMKEIRKEAEGAKRRTRVRKS